MKPPFPQITVLAAIVNWGPLHAAEPPPAKQPVETDLVLGLSLKPSKPFLPGEDIPFTLDLRNSGKQDTHPVIKPTRLTEDGHCEPGAWFTATIDTGDGQPKPVSRRPSIVPLLAIFAAAEPNRWAKHVLKLAPGETLAFDEGTPDPSCDLGLFEAGHVKLVAHYRYQGSGKTSSEPGTTKTTGPMAGVPPFELASAPVEFDIVKPLDLVLSVRRPIKTGTEYPLWNLFDVRLENHGSEDQEIVLPTAAHGTLSFQFEGFDDWKYPITSAPITKFTGTVKLARGNKLALLTAGQFFDSPRASSAIFKLQPGAKAVLLASSTGFFLDGTGLIDSWVGAGAALPCEGSHIKARALYQTSLHGRRCEFASEWVELESENPD